MMMKPALLQKQLNSYWTKQSRAQRITVIALLVAALVAVPAMLVWASTPTYKVAYSGLSEADAGQIVQKLDELGITYQIQDQGTILVPSDQVYSTRLSIAREGLPQDSTVGFELFDNNTLGMTEFTQRVNYQRALEGELERTISSLDAVEAVQVHIVTPEKSLLSGDQAPATASVTISEKKGTELTANQVQAMINLVSSSVEGLLPENVVVIDSAGNLLSGGETNPNEEEQTVRERQRAAETAAALEVKRRVQNMLDNVLGPDKAVVQASVSMDWTQREVTSNTYDPTPAAVRSSQTLKESYTTDGTTLGGVPGAASNLPTPVATVAAGGGIINYNREETTYNYEITQVEAKEVISPGDINRITLSVMVDNVTDAQQLETIRAAAAAAAGIDETRGDQVVVESIAFDRTAAAAADEEATQTEQLQTYTQIGTLVVIGVLLLALVLFFQRMLHNLRKTSRTAWQPIMMPASQLAMAASGAGKAIGSPASAAGSRLAPGEKGEQPAGLPEGKTLESQFAAAAAAEAEGVEVDITSRIKNPRRQETEQRIQLLTQLAEENPATVAEIIQLWLSEDNRRNG